MSVKKELEKKDAEIELLKGRVASRDKEILCLKYDLKNTQERLEEKK